MDDFLITYELAILAKLKGFDIKCKEYFKGFNTESSWIRFDENDELQDNCFERPTREELSAWLRETHNLYINVIMDFACTIAKSLDKEIEIVSTLHEDIANYNLVFEKGLTEALNTLPNAI